MAPTSPLHRRWRRCAWAPSGTGRMPGLPRSRTRSRWATGPGRAPPPSHPLPTSWDRRAPRMYPPPLTKVCKCHPHSGSLACEVPTSSEHPPSPAPRPHPSLQRARGSGEGGTWPRATAGHRRSWEGSQVGSQASALSASWRQGSGSECGPSTRWLPLSEGGRPRGQGRVCSRLLWGKTSHLKSVT